MSSYQSPSVGWVLSTCSRSFMHVNGFPLICLASGSNCKCSGGSPRRSLESRCESHFLCSRNSWAGQPQLSSALLVLTLILGHHTVVAWVTMGQTATIYVQDTTFGFRPHVVQMRFCMSENPSMMCWLQCQAVSSMPVPCLMLVQGIVTSPVSWNVLLKGVGSLSDFK